MTQFSQRRLYTVLMTAFATVFVIAITGHVMRGQTDILADTFKVAALIAVSTAIISYIIWTLTHLKKNTVLRGVIAGFLTVVLIIPIPTFLWSLKTQVLTAYNNTTDSLLAAVYSAIPTAIYAGLYTFIDITKLSLVAVVSGMTLGALIARFVKPKQS